jgi:hypothetical protein
MPRVLPQAARFLAAMLLVAQAAAISAQPGANTLTAEEKRAGWKLLFDGSTLTGWRGFKSTTPPAGWKPLNGTLVLDGKGGDLMTVDQYADFELSLEWQISPNGNGGIMFRVAPGGENTYSTGPEFQLLHNEGHNDGKKPITSAGSNFAVHEPARDVTKPVGQWNHIRLIVKGAHVEHWMNGEKLLEYELWSPDWDARVQASKFAKMPGYGRSKQGHLAIQDHGNWVAFRNIKIRVL